MEQKKRSLYLVLTLVLISTVVLAFTACTGGNKGNTDNPEITYELYYVNPGYIETGDESIGKLAEPVEGTVEDTFQGDKGAFLQYVIDQLKTIPEGGDYATIMGDRYTINGITVDGELANVDFSGENLNGGSLEEILLLNQIVETIVHSDPEITSVQVTVDGQEAETLMGHVDISSPLTSEQ